GEGPADRQQADRADGGGDREAHGESAGEERGVHPGSSLVGAAGGRGPMRTMDRGAMQNAPRPGRGPCGRSKRPKGAVLQAGLTLVEGCCWLTVARRVRVACTCGLSSV